MPEGPGQHGCAVGGGTREDDGGRRCHLTEGQWAATTELKVNELAPVTEGRLAAEATIVTMTRRSAVVLIDVTNADRMVAVAQGTCTIVDPKPPD